MKQGLKLFLPDKCRRMNDLGVHINCVKKNVLNDLADVVRDFESDGPRMKDG